MVRIQLNGEIKEVQSEVTLDRLLELFSLPSQQVAIELNSEVIRRRDWENTVIRDADKVEVVHFVGGG